MGNGIQEWMDSERSKGAVEGMAIGLQNWAADERDAGIEAMIW